jgi:hypothetical protein
LSLQFLSPVHSFSVFPFTTLIHLDLGLNTSYFISFSEVPMGFCHVHLCNLAKPLHSFLQYFLHCLTLFLGNSSQNFCVVLLPMLQQTGCHNVFLWKLVSR